MENGLPFATPVLKLFQRLPVEEKAGAITYVAVTSVAWWRKQWSSGQVVNVDGLGHLMEPLFGEWFLLKWLPEHILGELLVMSSGSTDEYVHAYMYASSTYDMQFMEIHEAVSPSITVSPFFAITWWVDKSWHARWSRYCDTILAHFMSHDLTCTHACCMLTFHEDFNQLL